MPRLLTTKEPNSQLEVLERFWVSGPQRLGL